MEKWNKHKIPEGMEYREFYRKWANYDAEEHEGCYP